ncbi:MAG TPA: alpha/beta hydrolase [Candidatus Paceibacterota bacterium]
MKKRIIIVHGWGGSPTADWVEWATEAFREKEYEVITPEMPDTNHPIIEKWVGHLKSVVGTVDENTYFIGHSIGCQTIMRFIETLNTKVKANLTRSVVVLGDDDPVVAYKETKKDFETRLGSEVVTLHGVGHITSGDGFGPFPQLIEIFENRFR